MKQKNAHIKGLEIIRSCIEPLHFRAAYNYIHNFKVMFGASELWKDLYEYCSKRRKYYE
jgi:hypothetical protein